MDSWYNLCSGGPVCVEALGIWTGPRRFQVHRPVNVSYWLRLPLWIISKSSLMKGFLVKPSQFLVFLRGFRVDPRLVPLTQKMRPRVCVWFRMVPYNLTACSLTGPYLTSFLRVTSSSISSALVLFSKTMVTSRIKHLLISSTTFLAIRLGFSLLPSPMLMNFLQETSHPPFSSSAQS